MKLFAFIVYFAVVLAIGIVFFIRQRSGGEKEYFLGGRSMGPWVTAMSAQASDMSGWLLMGFPGAIFAAGMGQMWIGIGLAIGTAANWLLVARRLRRFSATANDSITMPQYLTNRFATSNPTLKIVCAIIFLISFTVYVASAFTAGTKVFTTVLPILEGKDALAMGIFALIILVYTFMGGYKAVCWTDFFQGILMLVAILSVPIIMVAFGEFDPKYNEAFKEGVTAFNTNPFAASASDIVSGLAWGLGYFGMPHILVRFMSIKNSKMIKKASTVAIIWVVLTLGAAIGIAYFGRTFLFSDGEALASTLPGGSENIFINIVGKLFPAFVAGLLLAAIIAASMSTADSQLLVASSSFTSDLYNPIIRKNKASEKETLWVGRIVVIIVSVIAFVIALSGYGKTADQHWAASIMDLVSNAWGLFGAAFGPVVILSLFWKRMNYAGAVAGILGGAIVDIAWLLIFNKNIFDLTFVANMSADGIYIYEILPGFVVGAIVTVIVTLATKAPSAEVCEIYDRALDASIDD